ncbi:unnamed protein product [Soboliphyme baturini]|uniref:M20_dimer domain-containing protein n=1 Tax=Soboliphyme baturini TaxID=241478 RepID=A0A183IGZ4_9BILA|nr:unnamed protein product [Soboliphyme baturini]
MEESGSEGLEEALQNRKNTWLKDVDYVCIADNYWIGTRTPCITYGLRGVCYYGVEIKCASQDLHSGVFGGSVYEAMSDLVYVMDHLVDKHGKLLIPGIYDKVAPVTEEERASYRKIDFDVAEYRKSIGVQRLLHEDKAELLMHRWRYPTLSLHGIEGAFSGSGAKTIIPNKVIGKFSIRIVPNQTPNEVDMLVISYVKRLFKDRGTPNVCRVYSCHNGPAWLSNPDHPHYLAGRRAVKRVYGVEPDLTREGGSIPITITFQECTGKNVMLLAIGAGDDMAHSQNEKIDLRNYINGVCCFECSNISFKDINAIVFIKLLLFW